MNRINFAKYGFEKEGDHYILPAAPNLYISKSVHGGCVDICAHLATNRITYEEYQGLPKYNETAYALSGKKTLYELTENDLQTFVENCIILSGEIDKFISEMTEPTDEEIRKKYDELHSQYVKDYADAEELYNGLAKKCILNPDIDTDDYPFKWGMQYLAKAMSNSHESASVSFEETLERLNRCDKYYSYPRTNKLHYLQTTVEPTWYIKSAREYFEEALKRATEKK